MKPCVFIHTNHKQYIGALVSQYSFKRNSPNGDKFDVNIIHSNDHPFLRAKEGQSFLRAGGMRVWHMEDLQSFTPLRFLAPELMGYEGRAVVVDPDVFAVGDVYELLTRDMAGKAIMCRTRTGSKGEGGGLATSVMLLDCAKLTHWRARSSSTSCSRASATTWTGSCCTTSPRARSACSRTSGTISTGWPRIPSSCTTPSARPSRGRAACRSTSPGRTRRSSP